MIDLEKLERLHAEATPGPWTQRGNFIFCAQNKRLAYVEAERALDLQTAAYIVAACNAAPELIAKVRELERTLEILEGYQFSINSCRECPLFNKKKKECFHEEDETCFSLVIAHAKQEAENAD